MILIDTNLLIYAAHETAPEHGRAIAWLEEQLNGAQPVGLPWESLTGFVRIVTNPRFTEQPTSAETAWGIVESWLAAPTAWIPQPTPRHSDVLGTLIKKYRLGAKLIPDMHLVALAMQHGLTLCSADTDFARFAEIAWRNPLAED